MSKKLITNIVASLSVLAFMVFSFSNVLALEHEMSSGGPSTSPLTSPASLCKDAKRDYGQQVKAIRAKGLSLQRSPEEIKWEVDELKDYKKRVCFEAKYGYAPPLTSARQICKDSKKNLRKWLQAERAKGLSAQLSENEIRANLKAIRDSKKKVCDAAKLETGPLP